MKCFCTIATNELGLKFKNLDELICLVQSGIDSYDRSNYLQSLSADSLESEINWLKDGGMLFELTGGDINTLRSEYIDAFEHAGKCTFSIGKSFYFSSTLNPPGERLLCCRIDPSTYVIRLFPRIGKIGTIRLNNGHIHAENENKHDNGENSRLTIVARFLAGIDSGILTIPKKVNNVKVKNKKLTIKSTGLKTEKHLVMTHLRKSHFRVLRHPKFYENGAVTNPPRIVAVKETVVNREYEKFKKEDQ